MSLTSLEPQTTALVLIDLQRGITAFPLTMVMAGLLATELTPAVAVLTPALVGQLGWRLVPAPALLGIAGAKEEA